MRRWIFFVCWPSSRVRNSRNTGVLNRPRNTVKCRSPRGEIVEIALSENRFPVRATVGVCPRRPQVRPDRCSERTPT